METHLTNVFEILYITIGTFGVAIIVWGVVLTFSRLLSLEFSRLKHKSIYRERERCAISLLRTCYWRWSFLLRLI